MPDHLRGLLFERNCRALDDLPLLKRLRVLEVGKINPLLARQFSLPQR